MENRKIRKSDLIDFDFACLGEQLAEDFGMLRYYAINYSKEEFYQKREHITLYELQDLAEGLNAVIDFANRLQSVEHYNIFNRE